MTTKKTILTYLLLTAFFYLPAQNAVDLPIAKNILNAYREGTRSKDGKPGTAYWQNHADYTIHVKVVPDKFRICGYEEL